MISYHVAVKDPGTGAVIKTYCLYAVSTGHAAAQVLRRFPDNEINVKACDPMDCGKCVAEVLI